MKNIKKYLCAIVMMVISMTAFAQEDVFSGDWLGANKEGDLKVAFTLNCDGNWQLNPYNEKLFKFYSKIILWQRYASWLRACQPCIHSQWSVS